MTAAVVTPTYNERENLPSFVERVRKAMPGIEIIVVDDASPDGSGELAEDLGRAHGGVQVIHRAAKLGLGSAYREGFSLALSQGFDPIFQMDADLSHDPSDLPRLEAAGVELALGSRYVQGGGTSGWPLRRKIISRSGSLYARTVLGLPYRDLTGGFKCWRARCLDAIGIRELKSEGYIFQVETTLRAHQRGFEIREVPILFTERAMGVSKMNPRIALEAAWRVPALWSGR